MIAVEHNVPAPTHRHHRKYPYADLEIGQSFFVENGNPNSLAAGASCIGKQLKRKFRTAKLQGGVRVWRLA